MTYDGRTLLGAKVISTPHVVSRLAQNHHLLRHHLLAHTPMCTPLASAKNNNKHTPHIKHLLVPIPSVRHLAITCNNLYILNYTTYSIVPSDEDQLNRICRFYPSELKVFELICKDSNRQRTAPSRKRHWQFSNSGT